MFKKAARRLKRLIFPVHKIVLSKHESELSFWENNFIDDNGTFRNNWYKPTMLALAQEQDDSFISDKIVADFGCGPRGSLEWAYKAKMRIGIDVLADIYIDEFTDNLLKHDMVYLKSTEKVIPLPANTIDIMFTLNAIDHVDNFEIICDEILRVLKPGGEFIASFNLEEAASVTEPQCLTEDKIARAILHKMEIKTYRITNVPKTGYRYQHLFENKLHYDQGEEGVLWVRATKR